MCYRVTRNVSCESAAPRIARNWARSRFAEMYGSLGDTGEDAALVVSELITNCMRANAQVFSLTLVGHRGAVGIEATDDAAGWPEMIALTALDREHGRGLRLVDALSLAWGARVEPVGKTVWAELSTPGARAMRRTKAGTIASAATSIWPGPLWKQPILPNATMSGADAGLIARAPEPIR